MQAPGWVAIIDDDPSTCGALERLLQRSGIRSRSFGSTDEYLKSPAGEEPSCILFHVQLSDGLSVPADEILAHVLAHVGSGAARA